MNTISHYLADHHHHCDELFAQAEDAVAAKNWPQAEAQFSQFHGAMEHHFAMEEEAIFPAFEERTGMSMGPTQVMRSEHLQMRELFQAMADALRARDAVDYLGQSETLLMMMQQHNLKEEQILYPMADQALDGEQDALISRMDAMGK